MTVARDPRTSGRDYCERCVSCGAGASVQYYGERCARCRRIDDEIAADKASSAFFNASTYREDYRYDHR